jgi:hypothetical protein
MRAGGFMELVKNLSVILIILTSSCSSSNFKGQKKPTASPPAENNEVDNATTVGVQSLWFNSDSWFKNCLTLKVASQSVSLGCNKDTLRQEQFEIKLPNYDEVKTVNSEGKKCFPYDIVVETFKNIGSNCLNNLPKSCNGPYEQTPAFVRSVQKNSSLFLFQNQEQKTPEKVKIAKSVLEKISSWFTVENALKPGKPESGVVKPNYKLVTFFEDLGEQAVTSATASSTPEKLGIDFNDVILAIDSGSVLLEAGKCE